MDERQSPSNTLEKERILQSSQKMIQHWVDLTFKEFLQTLDGRLFNLADKADNNKDQARLFQTRQEITAHKTTIQEKYWQHIHNCFDRYLNQANTHADYSSNQPEMKQLDEESLSLVNTEELEEKLAITSIVQKAGAKYSEHLYALNQRWSVLNGGEKITNRGNPIAPGVFGEAIQSSIISLTLDSHAKILLFKVYDSSLQNKLKTLYEQLNKHFENHGVLPNLSYSILKNAAGQTAKKQSSQPTPPSAEQLPEELRSLASAESVNNQISLIETIRLLQGTGTSGNFAVPATQILANIQQLQLKAGALLNSLTTPQSFEDVNPLEFRQQVEQQALSDENVDSHTIELVGLLFEYMLNDQQLPNHVKTLLSYLHTPFLKIALVDKDFFDQPDHPARQLLNSLVAAGERWIEPAGNQKNEIYLQIKHVVQHLLTDFNNDTRIISELAFEFNHHLRQHARRMQLAEKRAMQAAQGENKLKEVRLKVAAFLKKKIGPLQLPSSIEHLLFEPWANFLAFNLLRFGSSSEQWKKAAQTVDDILWYGQIHKTNDLHTHKRLQLLKTNLPLQLMNGFETVGYDSSQAKQLLQALQQLQAKQAATATTTSRPVTVNSANIDDIDVSNTTTEQTTDNLLTELKEQALGCWFEFNAHTAEPQRLKLAWSNPNTLYFMFVNRQGQQATVKSGEQLAEGIRNGSIKKLKILENKPFFEKAMERVLEQLQQKEQNADNDLN